MVGEHQIGEREGSFVLWEGRNPVLNERGRIPYEEDGPLM